MDDRQKTEPAYSIRAHYEANSGELKIEISRRHAYKLESSFLYSYCQQRPSQDWPRLGQTCKHCNASSIGWMAIM